MKRILPLATLTAAVLGASIGALLGSKAGERRGDDTARVLAVLARGPLTVERIALSAGLSVPRVAEILTASLGIVTSDVQPPGRVYWLATTLGDKVVADA